MNVAKKIFFTILPLFIPLSSVSAHVRYVVPDRDITNFYGPDFDFLLSPLRERANLFLIAGTLAAIAITYFFLTRNAWFLSRVAVIGQRAESYHDLVSWMLRLGVGIALIGAGSARVFISPVLSASATVSFLEIASGFLLLAGFLLEPAIALALLLFAFALSRDVYLFGNFDFFAALVALFALDRSYPGIDDLLGIRFFSPAGSFNEMAQLMLRLGIGVAMMFLAVYEKFLNPHISEIVVRQYHLISIIPVSAALWVLSAGLIEFVVGLLLLVGFHTRLVTVIAFLVLSLSFFYFGEGVSSHVTLFSVLSVLFVTGGGKASIDSYVANISKSNDSWL